jgi:uncharacterized Tic20 family protein
MSEQPPPSALPPSTPPAVPSPPGGPPTSEERTMGMLSHLLAIFTWFIGPLVIWLMKKDTSSFIDDQGKESLNFQLTIGILYVAMVVLSCLTLGLGAILFPIAGLLNLVFCIMACIAANKGERYRYPFAIRLIK